MKNNRLLLLLFLFGGISSVGFAQNINKIEYFIDADPGYGAGTDVPVTAATTVTKNFTVSIASAADGFHFLNIRARDANSNWSVTGIRPFYKETIPNAALPNIIAMEYFIDSDPGYGLGTAVTFTASNNVTTSFTAALGSVTDGFHFLSIRAKDANNKWSVVGVRPFYKETLPNAALQNITAMEYFIDTDPGYGAATAVSFTANNNVTSSFTVALGSVSDGFHFLSIRAKDANNKWSVVGVRPFYKETIPNAALPNITAMEYFIDADPGYGLGSAVSFTAATPVSQSFTVSLGSLANGNHKLSIRAKDANNKWSIVGIRDFAVQDNIIVLGSLPPSWCKTTAFNIPFTISGTYTAGNVFTAIMSDANGSFSSPTTLGTLTSTNAGTISATIPNTVSLGSGYQIRIVSSTPAVSNSPTKAITVVSVCPPPCAGLLTLAHPADDILSGNVTQQASSTNGSISASNWVKETNTRATYQAKSITMTTGFIADKGTIFRAEVGGCSN